MDEALAVIEDTFRTSTLAQLIAEPGVPRPLCEAPLREELEARA
jgi:hypothetical protein